MTLPSGTTLATFQDGEPVLVDLPTLAEAIGVPTADQLAFFSIAAGSALDQLEALADDGKITASEKTSRLIPLSSELDAIWTSLDSRAGQLTDDLSIPPARAQAVTARSVWVTYRNNLSPAWNDTSADTIVDRTTFDGLLENYRLRLTDLADALRQAASRSANWSGTYDDDGNRPQDGATRNIPRGEWDAGTAYDQGDIVTYEGSSYIAGEDVPIGTYPTDATYWDELALGGSDGIPGPAGRDGTPSYVHVAYASSADGSQGFVAGIANPGLPYIGIYTDATSTGSSDYRAYYWSRLTGQDGLNGSNGTPGPVGADGRQSYVHFAYADSLDGTTNFTTGAPGGRAYLGVYSDYSEPDSNDPSVYAWSLIKGPQGIPGPPAANGSAAYVHIAYANSADGSQDFIAGAANPGRVYIGIYTDGFSSGSTDYHSYNWSRLTGQDGINGTSGTPGPVGADGRQSYVHFAYANSADGSSNFTTGDPGTRTYIGVYSDYSVPDSTDPNSYAWSLIKGADGQPGPAGAASTVPGPPGPPGNNGVSPSPKYTAFQVAGEGTWSCSYPVPLAPGQTVSLQTYLTSALSSTRAAPATVTVQDQYQVNGGGWNVMSNGSSTQQVDANGDLVEFSFAGSYTASGNETVNLRVVVSRTGNSDAQFGYGSAGYGQPS